MKLRIALAGIACLSLIACSGQNNSPSSPPPSGMEAAEVATESPDVTASGSHAPDVEGDPVPAFLGMLEAASIERGSATNDQLVAEGQRVCESLKAGTSLKDVIAARSESVLKDMDPGSYTQVVLGASEILCGDQQARVFEEYQALNG